MVRAVDFFCGIGGVTRGFLNAGIDVICGIDKDSSCKATYEFNNIRDNGNPVTFYNESIEQFDTNIVTRELDEDDKLVLIGCAPCQPFSSISNNGETKTTERQLLDLFADKVIELAPDYIFVENVSGLKSSYNKNNKILENFLVKLQEEYSLTTKIQNAAHFGVAQNRKRLIIFGKRHGEVQHPEPTHGKGKRNIINLKELIGDLPPIRAGETHETLSQHESAKLIPKSLERLECQKSPGDGMETWTQDLMLPSRVNRDYKGHTDVYSRLWWEKPSGTLTTKFFSVSNGRFAHPEQNRALSILEGLLIQSFPENYTLFEKHITKRAKQVGNAVPVKLAEAYAQKILDENI